MKPSYLLIDSKDRISGTSDDFYITLPSAITQPVGVKIAGLSLSLTQYTMHPGNNSIVYQIGEDLPIQILVPDGIYDSDSIVTALQDAFLDQGELSVVITYNEQLMKFEFLFTDNVAFLFGTYKENSAAEFLGFNEINYYPSSFYRSDNVPNLSIPPYIEINVDGLPSNIMTTAKYNATFVIFTTVVSGYITYHFDATNFNAVVETPVNRLYNLHIRLTHRGKELNLNNTNWSVLFSFVY